MLHFALMLHFASIVTFCGVTELFNTLKKETNLFLDSMNPSSAFATLISMKQGEKTQKIVAKYVCDRFRERERRVKYNLV